MKIALSIYDLYGLATGLAMMIEEQQKEKGVKPSPEDEKMILLHALLSLVDELRDEGGFVALETCPFPVNFKTEQGKCQLPEVSKKWLEAIMNQYQKGRRKTKPRRGKVGRPQRTNKYKK